MLLRKKPKTLAGVSPSHRTGVQTADIRASKRNWIWGNIQRKTETTLHTKRDETMTILKASLRAMLLAAIWLPMANVASSSEFFFNENFDNLNVGSAPDNDDPVGPWSIGIHPGHPEDVEDDVNQFSIVPTSDFVGGADGNSLHVTPGKAIAAIGEFSEAIRETENEIIRAKFDVFVPETETRGQPGFSLKLMEGNFSTFQNRGPQMTWSNGGRLSTTSCRSGGNCNSFRNVTVVDDVPVNTWQNVQVDIDLVSDTYDLFWGTEEKPMDLVAAYTTFRAGKQDTIDQFVVAYFNGINYGQGSAYLDNITVEVIKKDWIGDANLDGVFDSGDFVQVFKSAKYETGEIAGWSQGDWNGDRVFDSGDFVAAFKDGGYEMGRKPAVAAVPEPGTSVMAIPMLLGLLSLSRRRA